MKALVVDDDFVHRLLLQRFLQEHGEVHIAVNGREAIEAVRLAHQEQHPYDLVCLDIVMPEIDGHDVLYAIRHLETEFGHPGAQPSRVLMTSALQDKRSIVDSFREQADGYLVKPVKREKLLQHLVTMGLLPASAVP